MCASLKENAQIDEQVANPREAVYTFRVQTTVCHPCDTSLPVECRTPSFAQLYVSDSDVEAEVNMRCLDGEIVAAIQRFLSQVSPFVEMFLRAGELMRILGGLEF